MKKGKKFLFTALTATLAGTLTSGLALTAFADEATKDHEFDARNDVVFEDFGRADISDTVTGGSGVNLGEKAFLRVPYTAGTSVSPADAIYKNGSQSLGTVQDGGTVTLKLRAPNGDVDLSEIVFGVRGPDDDGKVLGKTLDELTDSEGESLPALTSEWQTYEISFATSYEDTDKYPQTEDKVSATPLQGIHLYAATATDAGTLDIATVGYTTTGSYKLNDFLGGTDVSETAKAADSGAWWAGSSEGYIVQRTVTMESGEFTVVKDAAVGDYKYAVIETAEGSDLENLKVATTADGSAWSNAVAYDGYSVALNGSEKGFKFIYEGSGSVTVTRIYLTNLTVAVPATAVPVIDASSAEVLEDFTVAQSGFTDVWEDMSTAPELEEAGLEYRISYAKGDKVAVADGQLVFDATSFTETDYLNFKFKSKTAAQGKYIVLKMKAEDGATFAGFRFGLISTSDAEGSNVVYSHQMKAGIQYPVAALDANNPYIDSDGWYYVVIDIEESGFPVCEAGYSGMNMYYSGTGKLVFDSVFFADKLADIERDIAYTDTVDMNAVIGYGWGGWIGISETGTVTTLSFDITAKDDNFSIDNLRLEFVGAGTYWASENSQGTLVTTDGKKLNELTYEKGIATRVTLDLSEIGAFSGIHVHRSDMNGVTLSNFEAHVITAPEELVELVGKEEPEAKTVAPEASGYAYAGGIDVPAATYETLSFSITPTGDNFDVSGIRLEFAGVGTYWASENPQGILMTADGKMLSELTYEKDVATEIVINLASIGIKAFSTIHIHTGGTDTGSFKLENIKLENYESKYYAEQIALLPVYLDTVAPQVSITTALTATAGDEITVAYTASDDMTAAADLNVTVSVTKDGADVALTDNKFTAEAGTYTVTVTVRDANGNEASDTVQITVTAPASNPGDPDPDPVEDKGGCGSVVFGGMGLAIAALGAGIAVFARKRKD